MLPTLCFSCCPDSVTSMLPTCIVFFLCWPGSVTSMLPTLWFRSYVAHVVFFLKLPGFVLLLMLPRSIIKRFLWCLDWLAELAVAWKLLKPWTHTHTAVKCRATLFIISMVAASNQSQPHFLGNKSISSFRNTTSK